MKTKALQRVLGVICLFICISLVGCSSLAQHTETTKFPSKETTIPETTAPKTTAPETTAPETTAPETTAPETTAPETTAPETTAPETTTPETTAAETTAPETTAPETTESKPASTEYILSLNTQKFHHKSCRWVKNIKEENKGTFVGDRDELISQGYEACGTCHP